MLSYWRLVVLGVYLIFPIIFISPFRCIRRILNILPYFLSAISHLSRWTGRRRFACQMQLLLLLAKRKWEVMEHLSKDLTAMETPFHPSSQCFGFYFILLLRFLGLGLLLTFAYQFVRIRSCCHPPLHHFPFSARTILLHTFGSHYRSAFPIVVLGEIGVNAARNQAKICLAFSFVFAWGVSLRFSGLRLWNRDLALGFFGPHSNILVPCLFAICCYVCLSLLTNGIWLEDFCCLVFMEILALNDSHLKFV